MNNPGIMAFWILVSYLVGSVPVGLLLARAKGIDIRTVGSGNIGATNVFRSVGKPWGVATFIADALKGFVPAFFFPGLAGELLPESGVLFALLCGVAAVAGHNWPVWLCFRGGKGVATSAGVLLGVAPAAVGIGLLTWIVLMAATRYVSVSSIGTALAVPAFGWWMYREEGPLLPVVLTLLGVLLIWRHKSNIVRLLSGDENRFDLRKRKEPGT